MRRLGALALLLTLSACSGGSGGSDESEPGAGSADATASAEASAAIAASTSLTVVVTDADDPNALFPLDDTICTSVNPAEKSADGAAGTPVEITLTNADGDVVGTEQLPETGGTFDPASGCTWEVSFSDLPVGEAFEVSLTSYSAGAGTTAAPGQTVELAF